MMVVVVISITDMDSMARLLRMHWLTYKSHAAMDIVEWRTAPDELQ